MATASVGEIGEINSPESRVAGQANAMRDSKDVKPDKSVIYAGSDDLDEDIEDMLKTSSEMNIIKTTACETGTKVKKLGKISGGLDKKRKDATLEFESRNANCELASNFTPQRKAIEDKEAEKTDLKTKSAVRDTGDKRMTLQSGLSYLNTKKKTVHDLLVDLDKKRKALFSRFSKTNEPTFKTHANVLAEENAYEPIQAPGQTASAGAGTEKKIAYSRPAIAPKPQLHSGSANLGNLGAGKKAPCVESANLFAPKPELHSGSANLANLGTGKKAHGVGSANLVAPKQQLHSGKANLANLGTGKKAHGVGSANLVAPKPELHSGSANLGNLGAGKKAPCVGSADNLDATKQASSSGSANLVAERKVYCVGSVDLDGTTQPPSSGSANLANLDTEKKWLYASSEELMERQYDDVKEIANPAKHYYIDVADTPLSRALGMENSQCLLILSTDSQSISVSKDGIKMFDSHITFIKRYGPRQLGFSIEFGSIFQYGEGTLSFNTNKSKELLEQLRQLSQNSKRN